MQAQLAADAALTLPFVGPPGAIKEGLCDDGGTDIGCLVVAGGGDRGVEEADASTLDREGQDGKEVGGKGSVVSWRAARDWSQIASSMAAYVLSVPPCTRSRVTS